MAQLSLGGTMCHYIPDNRIMEVSPTYVINDSPIALKRAKPNFFKRQMYDSQKQAKLIIGIRLRNQHGDRPPYTGILHLNLNFNFELPTKNKKQLRNQLYHVARPDLSNLLKMIEDICVDVGIIKDDALISSIFCKKQYSDTPSTTFNFTILKGKHDDD
jgi:Holliday junction resolvase RusA-like endonuclease